MLQENSLLKNKEKKNQWTGFLFKSLLPPQTPSPRAQGLSHGQIEGEKKWLRGLGGPEWTCVLWSWQDRCTQLKTCARTCQSIFWLRVPRGSPGPTHSWSYEQLMISVQFSFKGVAPHRSTMYALVGGPNLWVCIYIHVGGGGKLSGLFKIK